MESLRKGSRPTASASVDLSSAAADGPIPYSVPDITGLYSKDGLTRVAGNWKLYQKLLHQFSSSASDAPAQTATGESDFVETHHAARRPLFVDGKWPTFEKLVQDYSFAEAQGHWDLALN